MDRKQSQRELAQLDQSSAQPMTNGAPRLPDPLVPSNTAAFESRSARTPQVESPTGMTANGTIESTSSQPNVDPITAAQQEAAAAGAGAGYSDMSDTSSQQQSQAAFNLSIRNAPIAEESSAANSAAMASLANTLRAQAPTPTRRAGTLRGRRDVRNTVFIPSDQAPVFEGRAPPTATAAPPAQMMQAAPTPFAPPPIQTQLSSSSIPAPQGPHRDDRNSSDNQSVRSGRSLSSAAAGAGGAIRHPDIHTPGLNSSIIESVNATLESGTLVTGSVVGELALTHTPDPSSTTASQQNRETVRLDNFPILEKVAPNPAFVTDIGQSSSDRKGEYTVDLSSLSARPSVAFKYQLHTDPSNPSLLLNRHAPLNLLPSWKCEPTQTSVIVTYGLNSAYTGIASGEITLQNVVLALFLEGAKATSCQSKPAGTFSREKTMIYWRFEELKLSANGSQKALARFVTEEQGKPGRIEARWEIQPPTGAAEPKEGELGLSRLESSASNPFADESGHAGGSWRPVRGVRKTVAGQYVGMQSR
ncbi:MAG: hypothetical protein Q9159_006315 [Coniocarpon cinnabarinum]